MARLIECDRCGATQAIPKKNQFATGLIDVGGDTRDIMTPPGWMTLPALTYHTTRVIASDGIIAGGEFCERCVDALREWRKPLSKAKAERP